ncbi:GNAT family N-acetyltransferase [Allorhizocola rhizosphaerae]|uniref:GNAT family N-acetyltransferase n=1 Tax=Allorhizocola rhizosphaerae TaxID=1872709 RepID=UPI001B8BE4DC|nr:GNAT family N-acetyltransferase [Allorhizocola rhizosphaerae]
MTSMLSEAEIDRAQPADVEYVSRLLADAFLISPVGDWPIPDVAVRRRIYVKYFAIFVLHGLCHGIIGLNRQRTGVAIWYPRAADTPGPANYDAQLAAACGPWTDRFQLLDATFAERHPTEFHHHLAFLGVSLAEQSKGVGSSLLKHHHAFLDRVGIPAYLEASTIRSRNLYLRHGYHAAEPFHLPDDGPPLWPMRRNPRQRSRKDRYHDDPHQPRPAQGRTATAGKRRRWIAPADTTSRPSFAATTVDRSRTRSTNQSRVHHVPRINGHAIGPRRFQQIAITN